jgi:hypothetical protein
MDKKIAVELATGTLHLSLTPGKIPLHRLLGFASRYNSKRKFLLVSKVLGKHYPVAPRLMSWSYRALARQILGLGLSSPSLWIGMAETATGLGYGVYEKAWRGHQDSSVFLQTSRYHLAGCPKLSFEEAHSHAPDFFLYCPTAPALQKLFDTACTLVLIDDEISTGATFLRLIQAYRNVNPGLRQAIIASLVNFADPNARRKVEEEAGIPIRWAFLRQGALHFEEKTLKPAPIGDVNVIGSGNCKKALSWPGRLGLTAPIRFQSGLLASLQTLWKNPKDLRPLLVLGTGECNAPAYLLGSKLEQAGHCVHVQSTTRSPIYQDGIIASMHRFKDNYGEDIDNFLYNMEPTDYRDIILCHETPLCPPLLNRLQAWQAISARIETGCDNNATLHFFRP